MSNKREFTETSALSTTGFTDIPQSTNAQKERSAAGEKPKTNRPITLFTGQWADLDFEVLCKKLVEFGYDGAELACWGNHFEVHKANEAYCKRKKERLAHYGLNIFVLSNHLVGQCVCDPIDIRHKGILPAHVWGDGDPERVRQRAAQEMIDTGSAAKRMGLDTVVGFTGSPIWHLLYSFPAVPESMVADGYTEFARRWKPILDHYWKIGVRFALEVHPTEIAFDISTAERAIEALDGHPAFGFNYDPSHLAYQGVDYVEFIHRFAKRIFHVHIKDVYWKSTPGVSGVFGGHLPFGDRNRYWDFRSVGRGNVQFEEIIRALNHINYQGPLSIEWEDSGMNREQGATESCQYVRELDFTPSTIAFDSAMTN